MITYVFSKGRQSRVHNKSVEAKDFFYGYFDFINQGNKVQLIEFNTSKKIRKVFYIIWIEYSTNYLACLLIHI